MNFIVGSFATISLCTICVLRIVVVFDVIVDCLGALLGIEARVKDITFLTRLVIFVLVVLVVTIAVVAMKLCRERRGRDRSTGRSGHSRLECEWQGAARSDAVETQR